MSYYESLRNAGIHANTIVTSRGAPLNKSRIFIGRSLTGTALSGNVVEYPGSASSFCSLAFTLLSDTNMTYQDIVDDDDVYCNFKEKHVPDCAALTDTVDVSVVQISATVSTINSLPPAPINGGDTELYWHIEADDTDYPLAAGNFILTGV